MRLWFNTREREGRNEGKKRRQPRRAKSRTIKKR
jgi:hypothetical protein